MADVAIWKELNQESLVRTDIGRIYGLTEAGRRFLEGAESFCRAERIILSGLIKDREISKPELCRELGLPGRMFNTAKMLAESRLASARECHARDLEQKKRALDKTYARYADLVYAQGQEHMAAGLIRRMQRLRRRIRELESRGPVIHYGRKVYHKQHTFSREVFRRRYTRERNNHIGCLGSKDETAGNSTLQIRSAGFSDRRFVFSVFHKGEELWRFRLKEGAILEAIVQANNAPFAYETVEVETKDAATGEVSLKEVRRKVTAGRTALTVMLHRGEKKGWRLHVSYSVPAAPLGYVPETELGVDTNTDSLAFAVTKIAPDRSSNSIEEYGTCAFPREAESGKREHLLYQHINRIVATAKRHKSVLVLENLDFEGAKRVAGKLGHLLHGIPYAKILKIFTRKCLEHGVPLRLISPAYTSVLGGYFSARDTRLSRDVAAAVVIACKGTEAGYDYLGNVAIAALSQDRIRIRCNAKKRFGHTTTLVIEPARQSDTATLLQKKPFSKGEAIWLLARLNQETLRTVSAVFYSSSRKGKPRLLPCCYRVSLSPLKVVANPGDRSPFGISSQNVSPAQR